MNHRSMTAFPNDFLWGASTSAYQVEGASMQYGKGPSCQDVKCVPDGTSDLTVCSDHYHHMKEDIALMAEMGFKAYRFSIAWTRILPEGEGTVNQQGIAFYSNLINECIRHDIEPIITMFHFDMPAALDQRGSWSNPDSVQWFVEYAKILFSAFGNRVHYWLTINEQNILTLVGPVIGTLKFPESCENMTREIYQQNHHMLIAQAKAMVLCHEMLPDAKIGPAPNISLIYPQTCDPRDVCAAQNANALRNWLYLDAYVYGEYNHIVWSWLKDQNAEPIFAPGDKEALKNAHPDYLGINYYNTAACRKYNDSDEIGAVSQQENKGVKNLYTGVVNPFLEKTEFGWEIDPEGFRNTIREIYSRYHLPILITENGLGAYDELTKDGKVHDIYRIQYLEKHIRQMQLAIHDGCMMIGYCPWSALDLISTHEGMKKRYGFIYVNRSEYDVKDLKRYKKDSFYWYQKVIASNGNDLSL